MLSMPSAGSWGDIFRRLLEVNCPAISPGAAPSQEEGGQGAERCSTSETIGSCHRCGWKGSGEQGAPRRPDVATAMRGYGRLCPDFRDQLFHGYLPHDQAYVSAVTRTTAKRSGVDTSRDFVTPEGCRPNVVPGGCRGGTPKMPLPIWVMYSFKASLVPNFCRLDELIRVLHKGDEEQSAEKSQHRVNAIGERVAATQNAGPVILLVAGQECALPRE